LVPKFLMHVLPSPSKYKSKPHGKGSYRMGCNIQEECNLHIQNLRSRRRWWQLFFSCSHQLLWLQEEYGIKEVASQTSLKMRTQFYFDVTQCYWLISSYFKHKAFLQNLRNWLSINMAS
jgi:hypothetical protein